MEDESEAFRNPGKEQVQNGGVQVQPSGPGDLEKLSSKRKEEEDVDNHIPPWADQRSIAGSEDRFENS